MIIDKINEFELIMQNQLKPIVSTLNCILENLKLNSSKDDYYKSQSKSNISTFDYEIHNSILKYYNISDDNYCMILGNISDCDVINSYIWPKHTNGMGLNMFGLSSYDINNPRNFLRIHENIKEAFDDKRLYYSHEFVDDRIQLFVNIIDPGLLNELQYIDDKEKKYFSNLNGLKFDYEFEQDRKPFLQIIATHAERAIEKAERLQWLHDQSDIEARKQKANQLLRYSLGSNHDYIKLLDYLKN